MGLALWGGSPGLSGIGAVTPGTTPIVGGTDKRVLFDDNGVVGESSGFTFDKASSLLTTSGIMTANGGFNISNTALVNIFSIADTAWITRPGTTSTVALAPGGYWQRTDLYSNNAIQASVLSGSFSIGSGADVRLSRDAANTLALRNGVNSQTLNVYNTYTDASNYERGIFNWSKIANRLVIGTEVAGTGTPRAMEFQSNTIVFTMNGVSTWYMLAGGSWQPVTDATYDFGQASYRVRNGYFSGYVSLGATTVAGLPAAATAGANARMFVTDALAPAFGATVVGGGAVLIPVYSDGANWKVG